MWQEESVLSTAERFIERVPCIREVTRFLNQWLVDPSVIADYAIICYES